MRRPAPEKWYVVCPTYTVGPFTSEDAAQRRLVSIEQMAECREAHRVEQRDA